MVKKRPDTNHVIPTLIVEGAAEAMALYEKAFGAKEIYRIECADNSGKIMHACFQIGNTQLFIADTNPNMNSTPTRSIFYAYFDDVDATFAQAKQAGLTEKYPISDMFWGDRMGALEDRFGIHWTVATHVRDATPEEMEEGKKQMTCGKS